MTKEIELLNSNLKALVDDEDYDELIKYSWSIDKQGYIRNGSKGLMGRYIMKALTGQIVDHIDRNILNNRKCNLRFCSDSQNLQNRIKRRSKRYIGIYRAGKKWAAKIQKDGHQIYLGIFNDPKDAADEYDDAAIELFGIYAMTNKRREKENDYVYIPNIKLF